MSDETRPRLLSSGNPQIPKGDGPAPVRAYIAAMPGWQSAVGAAVDAIVLDRFPDVRQAVRWNTALYGKDDGWFLSMYCFRRYVQLGFLNGAALTPMPPKLSKVAGTRYLPIHEGEMPDSGQLGDWVAQAMRLPAVRL